MTESLLEVVSSSCLYEPQDPVNIARDDARDEEHGRRANAPRSPRRVRRRCDSRGSPTGRWTSSSAIEHYDSFDAAVADCVRVVGFTARRRAAKLRLIDPQEAAAASCSTRRADGPVALVFGREDSGLPNECSIACTRTVTIPTTEPCVAQSRPGGADRRSTSCTSPRPTRRARSRRPARTRRRRRTSNSSSSSPTRRTSLAMIEFFKTRFPEHIMRTLRSLTFRAAPNARELSLHARHGRSR